MDYSFPKGERLTSKIIIKQLFEEGNATFTYPFKLLFLKHPPTLAQASSDPPQVLISVPRRKIRKAVHRNWVKRRIREAYRLNKHLMLNSQNEYEIAYLGILYVAKEKIPFSELEKKLIQLLKRF